jgi:hypothetical protein
VLVVDKQELIARFGVRETDPAGVSGPTIVRDASHGMVLRKFLVWQREEMAEVLGW